MFVHTPKSIQMGIGKAPETLDAVDIGFISNELILSLIDAQVLVPDPSICILKEHYSNCTATLMFGNQFYPSRCVEVFRQPRKHPESYREEDSSPHKISGQ